MIPSLMSDAFKTHAPPRGGAAEHTEHDRSRQANPSPSVTPSPFLSIRPFRSHDSRISALTARRYAVGTAPLRSGGRQVERSSTSAGSPSRAKPSLTSYVKSSAPGRAWWRWRHVPLARALLSIQLDRQFAIKSGLIQV